MMAEPTKSGSRKSTCPQKERFSNIETSLQEVHRIIHGNGVPEEGLDFRTRLIESDVKHIKGKVDGVCNDVKDLSTNISALVKFRIEVETAKKTKEKVLREKRESGRLLIWKITAIVGTLITLTTLILHYWPW